MRSHVCHVQEPEGRSSYSLCLYCDDHTRFRDRLLRGSGAWVKMVCENSEDGMECNRARVGMKRE